MIRNHRQCNAVQLLKVLMTNAMKRSTWRDASMDIVDWTERLVDTFDVSLSMPSLFLIWLASSVEQKSGRYLERVLLLDYFIISFIIYSWWTCNLMLIICECAALYLGDRKSIWPVKKSSDEVLAWLSVCSEVQMICMWSSWCHCHPPSLALWKSRMVLPFWYTGLPDCPGKEAIKWVLLLCCIILYQCNKTCFCLQCFCLQCFDAVGWVAGRASGL